MKVAKTTFFTKVTNQLSKHLGQKRKKFHPFLKKPLVAVFKRDDVFKVVEKIEPLRRYTKDSVKSAIAELPELAELLVYKARQLLL